MKQSIKLILIIFILCLCGTYPVKADETYTLDSIYYFYDSSSNTYTYNMPVERIYPHTNYGNPVVSNVTLGATQYELKQSVEESDTLDNSTVLGSTVITGSRQGWMSGYKQTFKYLNPDYDKYQLHFNINQRRGGTTVSKIYYYSDNGWVLAYTDTVESASYSTGDIGVEFDIRGWMIEVEYTLNSGFAFMRADNQYSEGYRLNDFAILIKDSQTQADETQDKIEENTRNTNTILGTVKNAIDNVKNAIDNVVTGITNLPRLILDGLKDLFIPTDFYGDLETAMNDIIDALGIVGYPISLYTKTCYVVRDTTSTSLTVDVPAFYYKGQTIFPHYHRDNIFYFQNKLVFENVQKTTWMRQFFGMFNADVDTITIGNLVKTLMSIFMWFGILAFIIRIYNKAFGLDVNEEMGDDEE